MLKTDLTTAPLSSAASTGNRHTGRLRLWEIHSQYHCSLIGTCIKRSELRSVVKRCRIHLLDEHNDYALHALFVGMADSVSPAMRMLQKLVDRRFSEVIRAFAKATTPERLEVLWYEHFDAGRIAGGYWALMSHPLLTRELASRAHGEMHMLSHKASRSYQKDRQDLCDLKKQFRETCRQLDQALERSRAAFQERDLAVQKLKQHLRENNLLKQRLDEERRYANRLASGAGFIDLEAEVAALRDDNTCLRRRINTAQSEQENLQHRLAISEGKGQALNAELRKIRNTCCYANTTDTSSTPLPSCQRARKPGPPLDLCGRCVLVVGGRTGLCEHYRSLVERNNGRFIHHDGGKEESRQRLGTILQQADAVLCPLDNVSHDAIQRVKRYCEQHAKHLVFMPRSSLSTFARSLHKVVS